jgi:hypothetical protein
MLVQCFQCTECGFGEYEVGHLTSESEIHCVVCLEEAGRLIHLVQWEEGEKPGQARLRLAAA